MGKPLVSILCAAVIAGCGKGATPPAEPLPGAGLSGDVNMQPFGNGPLARPSIIRYDFSGSAPPVPNAECTTELVDGDPLHWKVLCPEHPYLLTEEEYQVDAQGYVIFHKNQYGESHANPADNPGWTVTAVDAAGKPLHADIHEADWVHPRTGAVIPGTGTQTADWAYDKSERLVHLERAVVGISPPFLRTDLTYDEANRRIVYLSIVDDGGIFGDGIGPGENGGYDQFDENSRRIQSHWYRPGGDLFDSTYSYDDKDRLVTTVSHDEYGVGLTVQIVERRIYE